MFLALSGDEEEKLVTTESIPYFGAEMSIEAQVSRVVATSGGRHHPTLSSPNAGPVRRCELRNAFMMKWTCLFRSDCLSHSNRGCTPCPKQPEFASPICCRLPPFQLRTLQPAATLQCTLACGGTDLRTADITEVSIATNIMWLHDSQQGHYGSQ